jgi:8-oxo-dGTP pyrophosphatase MutT (NUDIX family)
MSFVDRLQVCSQFNPSDYLPFLVDGAHVGLVRPEFAARLGSFPEVFEVSADGIRLADSLDGAEVRTHAVERVVRSLIAEGVIHGWRGESYTVAARPQDPPLFLLERAAVPLFGIWASGVHVNGFVRDTNRGLSMWVGRRSPDKHVAPDKLDQLVAGGRSAEHSVWETVLKEAEEEAGIGPEIAARAVPVGALSYRTRQAEGLRRDVLFLYDLELPSDYIPVNCDGEIASFELWPIDRVVERVRDSDDFKFNCALVVIDFLIRHGVITPDEEPDYLTLARGLRAG